MADLELDVVSSVPTPPSGSATVYVDSTTKKLKSKDDTGAVFSYDTSAGITALTGDVTASGSGSVVATVPNATVLAKVLTGLTAVSGSLSATDTILQAFGKIAGKTDGAWFGNMTDGNVTYAVNFTLVKDMYFRNLVINTGVTLTTAGFRIFADSVSGDGTIDRSGNDAAGSTVGAALAAGSTGASGAGGAAGVAGVGTAGGASATAIGTAGGSGGTGSGGAGGAGGTVTVPTAAVGGIESIYHARQASVAQTLAATIMTGGSGGGGGGSDGTAAGAGAGGAGVVIVFARTITGTLKIRAHGGNGGIPSGGNRGGGGGGGGGCIILGSVNDTTLESLTLDVAGGLGATGSGTGTAGSNGSVGRIVRIRI